MTVIISFVRRDEKNMRRPIEDASSYSVIIGNKKLSGYVIIAFKLKITL